MANRSRDQHSVTGQRVVMIHGRILVLSSSLSRQRRRLGPDLSSKNLWAEFEREDAERQEQKQLTGAAAEKNKRSWTRKVLGGLQMAQWIEPLSQITSYKKDLGVTEKGDKKDIMAQIEEKFASEPDLKKNVSYLKILAPAIAILMVKFSIPTTQPAPPTSCHPQNPYPYNHPTNYYPYYALNHPPFTQNGHPSHSHTNSITFYNPSNSRR